MIIHTVRPGDTLYLLSKKYGVPVEEISSANRLENPNVLIVGQALFIPSKGNRHIVKAGESLYLIALQHGIPLEILLKENSDLTKPYTIYPGQVIRLPSTGKKETIEVNGFCYPNIDMSVLNETLPYLTYLSIFSHEVRADGSLSEINDSQLIAAATRNKVAPIMVITNLEPGGGFSSDLAHILLTDETVQNIMIENVMKTIRSKGYYGLDVDFEYIFPTDREAYNRLLAKFADLLHAENYILSTSVAPKTSGDQPGVLYQAHDYEAHGSIADHVIIMTYEWGYTYGPPMAVAPLDQVKLVLDYAVTVIPPEKIFMGIPNYGYDWTLPFEKGTAARAISNVEAINLARDNHAAIQFNEQSASPFFEYYDKDKRKHIVWFEDARSIAAKLELVDEYGLGGVSYWTVNKFFPQNWLVLESMYNVKKTL